MIFEYKTYQNCPSLIITANKLRESFNHQKIIHPKRKYLATRSIHTYADTHTNIEHQPKKKKQKLTRKHKLKYHIRMSSNINYEPDKAKQ